MLLQYFKVEIMNRRVKKKVKRKIKTWVKLAALGFVLLVISGLLIYGWYLKKINEEDPTGTIIETNEQGTISDIQDELEISIPLEYTVLDVEGEGIFIDYGSLEILIDAPKGVSSLIKDKVDGELEYVVITNESEIRRAGLNEVSRDFKVKNAIGAEIEGAIPLPPGETIVLGDRFSLSTIKTESGLAAYLIYKDAGFLSLSELTPDDEYLVLSGIRNTDVIVASKFGLSDNNRIIKEKRPRYIAVSQKELTLLSEDLFTSAEKNPVYATGKTGKLLFSTTGQVVTAAFDVKDYLTPEIILTLVEEPKKDAEKSDEADNSEDKSGSDN